MCKETLPFTSFYRDRLRFNSKCRGCYNKNQYKREKESKPLLSTWKNMIRRCYKPQNKDYKYYGGRGIRVCKEWRIFRNFERDMFPSWKKGLQIDRTNNDGNYEPNNCRWVTSSENTSNRRVTGAIPYKGVSFHKNSKRFNANTSIEGKTKFIGSFATAKEASIAYENFK